MHGSTEYHAWSFSDSNVASPRQTHGINAGRRWPIAVRKKNTRPTALCVGAVPSLFGPSGADQRKVQNGCQNGQPWLDSPLRDFIKAHSGIVINFGYSQDSRRDALFRTSPAKSHTGDERVTNFQIRFCIECTR